MNMYQKICTLSGVAAAMLLASCGEREKTAADQPAPEVMTFNIIQQEVTDTGEWFGYLRGKEDTNIHPHVSGVLLSQNYVNGSFVKKDDVLFQIDPSIFEAELALAKANLAAAEAAATSAEVAAEQVQKDVDRYTPLVSNGAVSEKELDDARHRLRAAKAAAEAAHASVKQAQAAVDKAQINLDYTRIIAPYDGIIGTALVSQGELVSPATSLANITSINPIRFEFAINSDRLIRAFRKYGDINSRGEAKLPPPPPVQLVLEDGSVYPLAGKLVAMESKVGDSGLINVEGEAPNPDGILRGGMPVRVRIPLDKKEALLVPEAAIRSVLRSDFIIVVDRESRPHMVPVEVTGEYDVEVTEPDGYRSTQKLRAVSGARAPLEQTLREYGYEQPADAVVVVDEQAAVRAMNISSANSRMAADDPTPRGKITPTPFSYKPAASRAVMAAAAAGAGEKKAPVAGAKATLPPAPVKVTPLMRGDVAVVDEWFGSLRGVEEVDIRPQVSGFVLRQHFKDGTIVQKGDVLFTIDPAPYAAALKEAEANCDMAAARLEQAHAQLDRSQQDFDRYSKLNAAKPGAISDKTLTDARSEIKTNEAAVLEAEATVKQMEAARRLAEINLGYTTITAPFSGRVGIHKPSVGALVSPSDAQPLVTLSSVDPMRVDFQVSGKGALSGIAAYESADDTRGGAERPGFEIVLEDGSAYPARGQVVSADNALNRSTGTLRVVGQVENVDGSLRSGMPVRVRAATEPVKGAYLVPARAPLNSNGRDVLVLLGEDGAPDMLPITKGALVAAPGPGADGETQQPMQIVDVDRELLMGMLLAYAKAPSAEALVFQGANVEDWGALVLKTAGAADWRALLEKRAGHALPDDAPQQAGAQDWAQLALQQAGVESFRELALKQASASDELDLIARAQGFATPMELLLSKMGYADMSKVQVIVEGSLIAGQAYQLNQAAGARVNKLTPTPFHYSPPRTVVESVTADEASSVDTKPISVK